MAYDEGLAELIRADLAETSGVVEKTMFGGLCFMLNGNMLCGVHGKSGGGMFRVGKANEAAAKSIDGAGDMTFTGRKMGGMVDVDEDAFGDDHRRAALLALAIEFVGALPAK